jgi:hypothetical protein
VTVPPGGRPATVRVGDSAADEVGDNGADDHARSAAAAASLRDRRSAFGHDGYPCAASVSRPVWTG